MKTRTMASMIFADRWAQIKNIIWKNERTVWFAHQGTYNVGRNAAKRMKKVLK